MNSLQLKNSLLDFTIVLLALFIWSVLRMEFLSIFRFVYLFIFAGGVFYFGMKHHERQLYITFLFLFGLFFLNNLKGHDDYYFYILYFIFMSILSIISYFYPMKYRDEHMQLNSHFVKLRDDYNIALEDNRKADQKIEFYNRNVDIMFNIYNLSRRMIATVNSSEILDLSIEFFEDL